jgi:amino acid transporter
MIALESKRPDIVESGVEYAVHIADSDELKNMSVSDKKLAEMGYVKVYNRGFNLFSAFSFATSISGLFATVATTFTYPILNGGAASAIWCWIVGGIGCLCIAISVSELTSAYPTSGGMYFTCSHLVPKRYVAIVSWVVGWLNFLGQIAGVASK